MGIFPAGKSGREKSQLRQSRATQPSFIPNLVYAVFLCDPTTGYDAYSFTTDGCGIFKLLTDLGACLCHIMCNTREGWSGTNTFAQELTRREKKCPLFCPTVYTG